MKKLLPYKKSEFSITDTTIVKGVAICLLLFHHCFLQSAYDTAGGNINFFPVSANLALIISDCLKLCVGIFAFLSGYGMFLSFKKIKFNLKNVLRWVLTRLAKMMSGFYFVYIIVFIVTTIVDNYPITRYYTGTSFIKGTGAMGIDFLGLASLFQTRTLISTWWYITMAIIFVIAFPLLFKFSQKLKYIPLIVVFLVLPRIVGFQGGKSTLSFMLALIFGMIFANYNLFDKLANLKITKNEKVSNLLIFTIFLVLIALIPVLNYFIDWEVFCEFDFDIAPVIVVCFVKLYLAKIPYLRNVLYFFGKYSMNIYLVHTFFRYTYLFDFIYSFNYSLLIWLVLMALSLASAILIEGLKKLVRYDKLVQFAVKIINMDYEDYERVFRIRKNK